MRINQTYFLANSALGKLRKESSRPDHDLRFLVGHANILDSLMLDLAKAEHEQRRWLNKTVAGAPGEEEPACTHVETIEEEEYEQKKLETRVITVRFDSNVEEDDKRDSKLNLTPTPPRHSPLAPSTNSDSILYDESMPLSLPQPTIDTLSEK